MPTHTNLDHKPWQQQLAEAIRDPLVLLDRLELDANRLKNIQTVNQSFRLLVPEHYLAKMQKRNWADPLLQQVLPVDAELDKVAGFGNDPVGDLLSMQADGVLHKYQGRVLLVTTGACAIHCRYCFRRHFPYGEANPAKQQWQAALDYIQQDDSIHEVILSGGDPLVLADDKLQALCTRLAAIQHVKRLRIHTRLPVVLPARINADFLAWFSALPLQKIMVIHANHANEFCADVTNSLQALKQAGVLLFNQSVLLKGVNDSVKALSELSERLVESQVSPYYLHLLDKVQGAAHFDIPEEKAKQLMEELQGSLPGYMIPKLVKEVSGEHAKQPVA
jgi:EF-P beta-lysylation protein EpmB